MPYSLKNIYNKSINNIYKNDYLTNLIIFLTVILCVGYLSNKNYEAIIFLFICSVFLFLLCKNINYSIGISIILTNLFISFNFFKVTENFFNLPKEFTKEQVVNTGEWGKYLIYYLDNFINKGIDDRINLRLGQLGTRLAKEHNKQAKKKNNRNTNQESNTETQGNNNNKKAKRSDTVLKIEDN